MVRIHSHYLRGGIQQVPGFALDYTERVPFPSISTHTFTDRGFALDFSNEEILRHSEALFGSPMDSEKSPSFSSLLTSLDQANLRVVYALEDASEPMGHLLMLKGMRHGE
jgi:hypothetical protein